MSPPVLCRGSRVAKQRGEREAERGDFCAESFFSHSFEVAVSSALTRAVSEVEQP